MDEKKVDEEWKERASKEKEKIEKDAAKKERVPEADFATFLSGLGSQALVGMGDVDHPVSGKKEKNLVQAKYTIDLINILKEKTVGNLTEGEQAYLDSMLYDLRMRYVEVSD